MDYRDPIGDILKNSKALDNLPGKGKPLSKEYMERDVYQQFQKIARDSGYLPEWINIQKKITHKLIHFRSTDDLVEINSLISKYNDHCPPSFQRMLLTVENVESEKNKWL